MFQNPTMLAGLAGAMVPLVLHLLGRARYRNIAWGGMMFFGARAHRQDRYRHFKELVLLFLRMAVVGLLAVALARPVFGPRGSLPEAATCTVIILDHSGSMRLDQNGPPRLDVAKRAALDVLSNLRRGDEAALVAVPEANAPTPLLTTDLQLIAGRVSELRPTNGRADMTTALMAAAKILEQSQATLKHLVVVCDRQASSWREASSDFARTWRQSLRDAQGHTPLFSVIPIGGDDAGNVAIESVQILDPPVIRGVPAQVEVRVRNFDSLASTGLPLRISVGNQQDLFTTTLNLDARAEVPVRASITFPQTGPWQLRARIDPSGLTQDDTMEFAAEVIDPVGVLVISGDERESSAYRGETDFLRLALCPYQAARRAGTDMADVQVVTPDAWPRLSRLAQKVLVLANVPRLSADQVRQIEQFVYGGGGLLLAPGNLTQLDDYNAQLWRDGSGLLPAKLGAPVAVDSIETTSLLGMELSHPILRFLRDRDDPVPEAAIRRYFSCDTSTAKGRVLGRYTSGAPFMVQGTFGRGRVVLMTTPLDADWNNIPFSSAYLPLMQSIVRYLAAGSMPETNLWAREPIVAMIDDPEELWATLERPGSGPGTPPIRVDLLRVGDGYEARYEDTQRPGNYRLRVWTREDERHIPFAVRSPRDESDLGSFTEFQWQALQRSLGFQWVVPEPQAIAEATLASRRRVELWPFLLAAVLSLAVAEMALARFWTVVRPEVRP